MSEISHRSEVSVVGLGRMGAALARALLAGGRTVTVWNRDLSKASPLRDAGARVANSLESAVSESAITVVCVGRYQSWVDLVRGLPPGTLKGRIVIQLSTGAPDEARPLEELHRELGADSLDGAILAFPSVVGTEHSKIYLSGSAQTFEKVRSAIAPLGGLRYLGEAIQLSNTLDCALLMYSFGSVIAYLQAGALFESAGLPVSHFAEHAAPLGKTIPPWVDEISLAIAARKYDAAEATLNTLQEVWSLTDSYAERVGLPTNYLKSITTMGKSAIGAGYGEAEFAAMYEAFRPRR